ncbi:MAG: hypothetical protein HQ522_20280 [Bacteroidetes bacterium]|nr:hypothetical protein [Bacteroidota bacterium]
MIKAIRTGLHYFLITLIFFTSSFKLYGENPNTKRETNDPDYLKIVKAYAVAMISGGRDFYGTENTPLFASTLNRQTMRIGLEEDFGSIQEVRKNDRSIGGANPLRDIGLYEIMYSLSKITGNETYAGEADKSIKFFFTNCQSPNTGLMAWGEHLFWDFENEVCGYGKVNQDYHEAGGWPFWDKCYELAPAACWKFTIGEWDHQIADKKTGHFSRHARWSEHGPYSGFEFPRYAGQMIERWADVYQREENTNQIRRDELLTAIKVIFGRMQANTKLTKTGYLPAGSPEIGDHVNVVWLKSNLELARCLNKAAPLFDKELAGQMKKFALKQDIDFLDAPHKLDSVGGGFAVTLDAETGIPRIRSMNKPYTTTWGSGYGYGPHSQIANLCYSRYYKLKTDRPDLAVRYKNLMLSAAEQYLLSSPDTSQLLKPGVFADVIELMLNSFEISGDQRFYKRAHFFGQFGIELFLDGESPLPKATNQHNHYETITGGPAFMNELLKIYLTEKV